MSIEYKIIDLDTNLCAVERWVDGRLTNTVNIKASYDWFSARYNSESYVEQHEWREQSPLAAQYDLHVLDWYLAQERREWEL